MGTFLKVSLVLSYIQFSSKNSLRMGINCLTLEPCGDMWLFCEARYTQVKDQVPG